MKDKSENRTSTEAAAKGAAASPFATTDELVGFASGYFASDFPNPERLDCPPSAALAAYVRSGRLPDAELRAHLFGCSECFREYRSALAESSIETTPVTAPKSISWWREVLESVWSRPLPAFACALSLMLLVVGGIYVWREYHGPANQFVVSQPSAPATVKSEPPSIKDLPSAKAGGSPSGPEPADRVEVQPKENPAQQRPPVQRDSSAGELIAMSIDLGERQLTRGEAHGGSEVKFSNAYTRLSLTLPEGSPRGLYTVTITDVASSTRVRRRAYSADGKTLATNLDMRALAAQKYVLRITHEGEPPIDVPIVVTATKTASPIKKP